MDRPLAYLDYQAATPIAPEVRDAMLPWLDGVRGSANPHSPHAAGRAARAAVEVARAQIMALMPPGGRMFFTSGATEAANWALRCGGRPEGALVTLASEHACVLDTVRASGRGVVMSVRSDGLAPPEVVDGAAIVAVMLVNNEIGVVQDCDGWAAAAHDAGALFFCDAVQGFGRIPLPQKADFIAISAHKIHGPKGIGALWVRDGVPLAPLLTGGAQEGGLRSGTLSPALCAGFGVAAALCAQGQARDAAHVTTLFDRAWGRLQRAGWILNGSAEARYRGNLNVRKAGVDASRVISELRDVALSAGSACASGSGRPSHVLSAIGLTPEEARSSLRIGFGRYSTLTELDAAIDRIEAVTS